MTALPHLHPFSSSDFLKSKRRRLLIVSEGFEERSLTWIRSLPSQPLFEQSLMFKYKPERISRAPELIEELKVRSKNPLKEIVFNRFDPIESEFEILSYLTKDRLSNIGEVVVDISVMSKLMIVMTFFILRSYSGAVRCIYSEPVDYKPSREDYEKTKDGLSHVVQFPTYGVHDVIRTPLLSSSVMQMSPTLIVAFTSFNEQLVRALLSTISPAHLFLINGVPPHLEWRAKATQEVHAAIIEEYKHDNPLSEDGKLIKSTSTLDYQETIQLLSEIYLENCFTKRILLAPTGSKMQAFGCSIIKSCCPEIHIEYPTPESFFAEGFSSAAVRQVHEVYLQNFSDDLKSFSHASGLDG